FPPVRFWENRARCFPYFPKCLRRESLASAPAAASPWVWRMKFPAWAGAPSGLARFFLKALQRDRARAPQSSAAAVGRVLPPEAVARPSAVGEAAVPERPLGRAVCPRLWRRDL